MDNTFGSRAVGNLVVYYMYELPIDTYPELEGHDDGSIPELSSLAQEDAVLEAKPKDAYGLLRI